MKLFNLLFGSLALGSLAALGFSFSEKKSTQLVENQSLATLNVFEKTNENPVEYGKINWSRDFEKALSEAQKVKKPLLVLFQEVPGCSTCTRFGNVVLSHPLLVEAVETYFVPVVIHNNKAGADRQVLEKYGEPAWNNPVVRILSSDGSTDLVPRIAGNYTPLGLASGIVEALKKTGQATPKWLNLLENELKAAENGTSEATFSMFCFWTGEGKLGALNGVVATEPGYMDGREVVRVTYDPTAISFEELLKKSKETGCAGKVFCQKPEEKAAAAEVVGKEAVAEKSGFRPDRESKYYLRQTDWRFVPMTETQASRANSLVGNSQSPEAVLSARQIELGKFIAAHPSRKWKNAIGGSDFIKSWADATAVQNAAN